MATIKIARFWSPRSSPALATTGPVPADGLAAFGPEAAASPVRPRLAPEPAGGSRQSHDPAPRKHTAPAVVKILFVALLGAAAGIGGFTLLEGRRASAAQIGTVAINTHPAGAEVRQGGQKVGTAPMTLQLPPGDHDLEVVGPSGARALRVSVTAGSSITRDIEFMPAPVAPAATAALSIQTEPSGLAVLVDGELKGKSPLTVENLTAGDHQVTVRGRGGDLKRSVSVTAGQTMSLVVAGAEAPAAAGGWLAVSSPVPMQLREDGRLIGSTESERLMLSAGVHEIEIVNELLGYRETRKVAIAPGRTSPFTVELPNGALSVNALPWAEVWLDGERLGETPIANLQRRIGTHELIFRHPDFGERKETIVITVGRPARIGIDMRGRRP